MNNQIIKASMLGHHNELKRLVFQGADVNLMNEDHKSVLMLAVNGGHLKCAEILLKAGADVNFKATSGGHLLSVGERDSTPLISAISSSHWLLVELLLNNGADLHLEDRNGRTSLLFVCKRMLLGRSHLCQPMIDLIKELLSRGSDINHLDCFKQSALMLLCKNKSATSEVFNLIKLFVKQGADLSTLDINNKSALDYAMEFSGNIDVVNFLISNQEEIQLKSMLNNKDDNNELMRF